MAQWMCLSKSSPHTAIKALEKQERRMLNSVSLQAFLMQKPEGVAWYPHLAGSVETSEPYHIFLIIV